MKNFRHPSSYTNTIHPGAACGLLPGVFDHLFLCCCCLTPPESSPAATTCALHVETRDRTDSRMPPLVTCCFSCLSCGYLFWASAEFLHGYCILFGCCRSCFGFSNFWVPWVGWGFVVRIPPRWSCRRIIECLEFYVVGSQGWRKGAFDEFK